MKIYCQLKGSTFYEGQNYLQHVLSSGKTVRPSDLYFIREPENLYDSNCVQVWCRDTNKKNVRLGNVNKENAPKVAVCMDKGGTATVTGIRFYGKIEQGQNVGMYFTVNAVNG